MTESQPPPGRRGLSHRIVRMTGRDPDESHRTATPLELLFDLTFVVAFGQASDQLAHLVADAHVVPAIGGFVFAMFAICWAWINFSWFASAYDTDDWFFRIATMFQMVGVLVLALGLPAMFHALETGESLGNGVVVAGYVIMRLAMIALWLRVAVQDPQRRPTALTYASVIFLAQCGWVALVRSAHRSASAWCSCRFAGGGDRRRVHRRAPDVRNSLAPASSRREIRPADDHCAG